MLAADTPLVVYVDDCFDSNIADTADVGVANLHDSGSTHSVFQVVLNTHAKFQYNRNFNTIASLNFLFSFCVINDNVLK